jgi:hypothetical protein
VGQLQVLDHGAILVGAPGHPQVHLYESYLTRLPGRKHPCIYKKGPRCRPQSASMNSNHSPLASERPDHCRTRGGSRGRRERGEILDAFCLATGYHRKYALAVLSGRRQVGASRPVVRARRYGLEFQQALPVAWEDCQASARSCRGSCARSPGWRRSYARPRRGCCESDRAPWAESVPPPGLPDLQANSRQDSIV